ncbi:MAG TPA: hypothetical protein VMW34_06460 [Anaerolineales bacterium]|nr:hypothetical protein [Anaerolineales bacterium]
MALQFTPYPVKEKQTRDFGKEVGEPFQKALMMLVQMDQQKKQQELQKELMDIKRKEARFQYGYDVPTGMEGLPGATRGQQTMASLAPDQPYLYAKPGLQGQTMQGPGMGPRAQVPTSSLVDRHKQFLSAQGQPKIPMSTRVPGSIERKESFDRADLMARREQTAADREFNRMVDMSTLGMKREELDLRKDESFSKAQKPVQARKRMTNLLFGEGGMQELYDDLNDMGAIVNEKNPSLKNVWNRASASDLGQSIGKSFGTRVQSKRNQINQKRPLLINYIRQASEMGARGLDSEKELEFYLQAATDPGLDYKSNINALQVLDEAYGSGGWNSERPYIADKNKYPVNSRQPEGQQGTVPFGQQSIGQQRKVGRFIMEVLP